MQLHALRAELHQTVVDVRAIESLVSSERFARVYRAADETEKEKIVALIRSGHRQLLAFKIRNREDKNIYDMTIRELRDIARRRRVTNYSRLLKCELLTVLDS